MYGYYSMQNFLKDRGKLLGIILINFYKNFHKVIKYKARKIFRNNLKVH